ncbi:hypothetical protein ABPG75_013996 [Micractinium tetrahymenae]
MSMAAADGALGAAAEALGSAVGPASAAAGDSETARTAYTAVAAGARLLLQQSTTGNGTAGMTTGAALDEQLTQLWVLQCAFLVFFMQCGFALLEAGSVRHKNTRNILLKNVFDACVSTLAWWAVGYAFAVGQCGNSGFIGYHYFFSIGSPDTGSYWALWFFGWAFSATSATVVSGALAERAQFRAYLLYTSCISSFIYPVVAHWLPDCSTGGYQPLFSGTMGVMDFAGSGVVHMVGGGAALVGAILLGPRIGRFSQDGTVVEFCNASPANMALGVFILWLGWYGFNAGSTQCFFGCMPVAAQVAVNTTLATGAGGLTCLFLAVFNGNPRDIGPLLNGILAGAVSITANCALVQSYAAVIIGAIGACVYTAASRLLLRLRVDDPVDASPVHFFCGAWGLLAVGFFATETSTQRAYSYANDWGVLYGGSGKQLGMQLLGIACITAWTCTLSLLLFAVLRKLGWLRVDKEAEQQGLDITQGIGTGVRGSCLTCLPCFRD